MSKFVLFHVRPVAQGIKEVVGVYDRNNPDASFLGSAGNSSIPSPSFLRDDYSGILSFQGFESLIFEALRQQKTVIPLQRVFEVTKTQQKAIVSLKPHPGKFLGIPLPLAIRLWVMLEPSKRVHLAKGTVNLAENNIVFTSYLRSAKAQRSSHVKSSGVLSPCNTRFPITPEFKKHFLAEGIPYNAFSGLLFIDDKQKVSSFVQIPAQLVKKASNAHH